MKKVYFLLQVLFSFKMSAQKVNSVQYLNQANERVFVVDYEKQGH